MLAGPLFNWWRGRDSNPRPLGYEPNELPLLHPAAQAQTPQRNRRLGSGGARSGLASHRVAPAVLSGAAAGHDRVRDGTGWGHRALGHGHPPTPNVCPVEVRAHRTERVAFRTYLGWLRHACAPVVLPSRAGGRRASWFPAGPYEVTPPGERSPFGGSCEKSALDH